MPEAVAIALIGAGSMGGALLKGWIETGVVDPRRSFVFDPSLGEPMVEFCRLRGVVVNAAEISACDAVVLAVKPQMAAQALAPHAEKFRDHLLISVMAGASTGTIARYFGAELAIIRAMPNLPVSLRCGASGLFANAAVSNEERLVAQALFTAVGEAVWVEREEMIDAVTALSGSGPAYFFLMVEAMAAAGEALGISADDAERLARATLIGAGAMARADDRTISAMRDAVTSPGGTTAAALDQFDGENHALHALARRALQAAADRADELSG